MGHQQSSPCDLDYGSSYNLYVLIADPRPESPGDLRFVEANKIFPPDVLAMMEVLVVNGGFRSVPDDGLRARGFSVALDATVRNGGACEGIVVLFDERAQSHYVVLSSAETNAAEIDPDRVLAGMQLPQARITDGIDIPLCQSQAVTHLPSVANIDERGQLQVRHGVGEPPGHDLWKALFQLRELNGKNGIVGNNTVVELPTKGVTYRVVLFGKACVDGDCVSVLVLSRREREGGRVRRYLVTLSEEGNHHLDDILRKVRQPGPHYRGAQTVWPQHYDCQKAPDTTARR